MLKNTSIWMYYTPLESYKLVEHNDAISVENDTLSMMKIM